MKNCIDNDIDKLIHWWLQQLRETLVNKNSILVFKVGRLLC